MFEFVVTEASLREVINRTRPAYTQWVYDVLGTWMIQSEGEEPPTPGGTFEDRRFGMISVKDRRLLQEALDRHCEAFMTMGGVHRARDGPAGNETDDILEPAEPLRPTVLLTAYEPSGVASSVHSACTKVRQPAVTSG